MCSVSILPFTARCGFQMLNTSLAYVVINSVLAGSTTFTNKFIEQLGRMQENGGFVASEEMTKVLRTLKMSWDVEIERFNGLLNDSEEAGLAEIWRYYGSVLHGVILVSSYRLSIFFSRLDLLTPDCCGTDVY